MRPRPRDGIVLVRVDIEDEGRGMLVFPGPEVEVWVVPWSNNEHHRSVEKGINPTSDVPGGVTSRSHRSPRPSNTPHTART